MATTRRWVYFFGKGKAEGNAERKDLLGGKGAGLAEMTRIGLPVPAGFTITTEACKHFHERDGKWPQGVEKQIRQQLARLERATKKKLGAAKNPLLVSVRSGAARSMPGMMETILNLGLNDKSVEGLAAEAGDDGRRFAFDAYRRLIMMYGATAKGIDREHFENAFDEVKRNRTRLRLGLQPHERVADTDVSAEELELLVGEFKRIYQERASEPFPESPYEQLKGAINAVFDSWMAPKAVTYRRVERIRGLTGTAVNVCQMVFGNMGSDSGTGVCFTRDPSTGEAVLYGEALINAQGEDVVSGSRTPLSIADLKDKMPDVYDQLEAVRIMLEVHYKEMQDLEFTVERGKLFMLQCRAGKRSAAAAFKIAVDQATRGIASSANTRKLVRKKYLPKKYATAATKPLLSKDDAIRRIHAEDVERLFFPILDPTMPVGELDRRRLGEGIGAVPGAAFGEIVFTAQRAEERAQGGVKVILVRKETSPEDVGGMHAAVGILTATGGKTSHAAVVARGWGKCCIVGCGELNVHGDQSLTLKGRTLREGDVITLDGTTGRIYEGAVKLVQPDAPAEFHTLMAWCDKKRRLRVRANADTPSDAAKAIELGAEGIGLCRTEHMFFDSSEPQRLRAMRQMILAEDDQARNTALAKLIAFQRQDFEGIFRAMNGKPVTIRLLDPPLHEFLPGDENPDGQRAIADDLNEAVSRTVAALAYDDYEVRRQWESKHVTIKEISDRVAQLREANPMLGHRGCRLCVTFPAILDMQVRAIMEAAAACIADGVKVQPEIMIPLSIDPRELSLLIARARLVADAVLKERKVRVPYLVGTMVETPRAALLADAMAESADFFSFGTNDLTQLTMGLSRDDSGRFLPDYLNPEPRAATDEPLGRDAQSVADSMEITRTARSSSRAMASGDKPTTDQTGPILPHDPFQSLDVEGVGLLIRSATQGGRRARRTLKVGICGEHGGDPDSVRFFEQTGLDYVSCSPFRVPVARLAAAQAMLNGPAAGPRILKANAKPRTTLGASQPKARTAKAKRPARSAKKKGAKRGRGR